MTYLAEKMQHFVDQINSADTTWLNYREHLKTNLASAQSAFVDLTKRHTTFKQTIEKAGQAQMNPVKKAAQKNLKNHNHQEAVCFPQF